MPPKTATCCREKDVLVTAYVEKPKRKVPPDSAENHHHSHRHSFREEVIQHRDGGVGKGYDRRAELLSYSQRLRASAGVPASSSTRTTTASQPQPQPQPISPRDRQHVLTKNVLAPSKPKQSRTPTCLGNWRIWVPSFPRIFASFQAKKIKEKKKQSGSTICKLKAAIKSLQEQKWGFSKLCSTLPKRKTP